MGAWNASEGPPSEGGVGMDSELLMVILYMTLFVVGFVGNAVVIISILHIFFTSKKMAAANSFLPNVVFIYVLGLSITDFLVVCHLPFLGIWLMLKSWLFGGLGCRAYMFAENANKVLSTFILTALSWDRYIAVRRPTEAHIYRSARTASGVVGGCFLLAFLLLLPVLVVTDVVDKRDLMGIPHANWSANASAEYMCMFQPREEFKKMFTGGIFLSGYAVPGLLMSFFYVMVLRGLRSHSMTTSGLERAKKVSFRVLCVILFYFFCWTPHWIMQMVLIFDLLSPSRTLVIFNLVAFLLTYLNSSVNPILYAFLNRELRRSHTEALEKRLRSMKNVKKSAVLMLERHSERLLHLVSSNSASTAPGTRKAVRARLSTSNSPLLGQRKVDRTETDSVSISML